MSSAIPKNENALRQQGVSKSGMETHLSEANDRRKIWRVLEALKQPEGLNRFDAERIGEHCLNTTVARLRCCGFRVESEWEEVPSRFSDKGVRVRRYWVASDGKARS